MSKLDKWQVVKAVATSAMSITVNYTVSKTADIAINVLCTVAETLCPEVKLPGKIGRKVISVGMGAISGYLAGKCAKELYEELSACDEGISYLDKAKNEPLKVDPSEVGKPYLRLGVYTQHNTKAVREKAWADLMTAVNDRWKRGSIITTDDLYGIVRDLNAKHDGEELVYASSGIPNGVTADEWLHEWGWQPSICVPPVYFPEAITAAMPEPMHLVEEE